MVPAARVYMGRARQQRSACVGKRQTTFRKPFISSLGRMTETAPSFASSVGSAYGCISYKMKVERVGTATCKGRVGVARIACMSSRSKCPIKTARLQLLHDA